MYAGAVGAGAWARARRGERTPLHTSTLSQPPDIRLVASKSHRTARIDAVKRALQITDEMNVGSIGLKIGLVSEARARPLRLHGRAHEDLGHLRPGSDPRRRRAAA